MIFTTVGADVVMIAIVGIYLAAQLVRRPVPVERLKVRDTMAHPLPTSAPPRRWVPPGLRVTGAQPALLRPYVERIHAGTPAAAIAFRGGEGKRERARPSSTSQRPGGR
jgi:hypothetical protein